MDPVQPVLIPCPEPGCDFKYNGARPSILKNHKAGCHVASVNVRYHPSLNDTVIHRTSGLFHCIRCSFKSPYPSVIQKHTKSCEETPTSPEPPESSIPRPLLSSFRQEPSPIRPEHSPSPNFSPSCSPQELDSLNLEDYVPVPGQNTVIHHPPYNLPSMGIVISLQFRCLVCLKCERAIDSSTLLSHLRKDLPLLDIPEDLPSQLETTYNLIPYSSIVYTPGPVTPVFGIPLQAEHVFFCDCGKGFSSFETLRPHQTRVGDRECPYRANKPGFHKGYAQRLTARRPLFEIDPTPWLVNSDDPFHYPLAFSRSLPPLRDYSKMEIKETEDEMNTSSFYYMQRWLAHLEGYTPEDINEATRSSSPEAPYGEKLREIGELFLASVNTQLQDHDTFGILKLMGQTTEYVPYLSESFFKLKFVL